MVQKLTYGGIKKMQLPSSDEIFCNDRGVTLTRDAVVSILREGYERV